MECPQNLYTTGRNNAFPVVKDGGGGVEGQ